MGMASEEANNTQTGNDNGSSKKMKNIIMIVIGGIIIIALIVGTAELIKRQSNNLVKSDVQAQPKSDMDYLSRDEKQQIKSVKPFDLNKKEPVKKPSEPQPPVFYFNK